MHSFLSDVMEDRVETLSLPSLKAPRGSACPRKRRYSSVCSGLKLGGESCSEKVLVRVSI